MGAVDGTLVGVGAEVSWEVNLAPFFAPRPPLAHWCGLAAVTPAEALVLANRLRALHVGIEALTPDIAAAPPHLHGRFDNSNLASRLLCLPLVVIITFLYLYFSTPPTHTHQLTRTKNNALT